MKKQILILILSILFFQFNTKAQSPDPPNPIADNCVLACLDKVSVSVDQSGTAQVWAQDFLANSCNVDLKLTIIDEDDNIIFEQQEEDYWTIDSDDVDHTYVYTIEHLESENKCWGEIFISDDGTGITEIVEEAEEVDCLDEPLDFTSFTLDPELEFTGKTIEQIDTEVFIDYFLAWDSMILANNIDPQNVQTIAGFSFSDEIEELENGDIIVNRTFELIDWCHYVPHSGDELFTFEQKITIKDLGSMLVSDVNFAESGSSISINKMTLKNEIGQAALVQLKSDGSISDAIDKTIETQQWSDDSFQVEVEKYESCNQSITSVDLVQVLRHIIDVEVLESNVRLIAADVDDNNQITARDLVKMRNIILGLDNCDNQSNWEFYNSEINSDIDFNLNNSQNYSLKYANESDMSDFSIVALKKGDVNLSSLEDESESRTYQNALIVKNDKVKAGQIYTVEFNLSKDIDIISASINIENPSFEILDITSKGLDISESNYNINQQNSKVVFYEASPIELNEGDNILTLSIKANDNGTIKSLFNSSKIVFNSYSSASSRESISLGIEYGNPEVENTELKYSPILNQGTLSFKSITGNDGILQNVSIFSIDGRRVQSLRDVTVNNVNIDLASHSSQLLVYRLATDQGYTQTGRFFVQ